MIPAGCRELQRHRRGYHRPVASLTLRCRFGAGLSRAISRSPRRCRRPRPPALLLPGQRQPPAAFCMAWVMPGMTMPQSRSMAWPTPSWLAALLMSPMIPPELGPRGRGQADCRVAQDQVGPADRRQRCADRNLGRRSDAGRTGQCWVDTDLRGGESGIGQRRVGKRRNGARRARRGQARRGRAGCGQARCGQPGCVEARCGQSGRGWTGRIKARCGQARCGGGRRGQSGCGQSGCGPVQVWSRLGVVSPGVVRLGVVSPGAVRSALHRLRAGRAEASRQRREVDAELRQSRLQGGQDLVG